MRVRSAGGLYLSYMMWAGVGYLRYRRWESPGLQVEEGVPQYSQKLRVFPAVAAFVDSLSQQVERGRQGPEVVIRRDLEFDVFLVHTECGSTLAGRG